MTKSVFIQKHGDSKTNDEFISASKKKYPNKLKYDRCQYVNAKTNVTLYCTEKDENGNEHGYFTVNPCNHIRGTYGCKKCQYQNLGKKRKDKKVPQLIKESKIKFGEQFLYDHIMDDDNGYKLYCTEKDENGNEHGFFTVKHPYDHLSKKNGGCLKCHVHQHSTESFVKQAKIVHGDTFSYSKTDLDNRDEKGRVLITCTIHGDFWQEPSNHLQGQGCPKCQGKNKTTEEWIEEAKKVLRSDGNKYDYSKVNYINSKTPVTIICPIHGEFQQIPYQHLKGCGCPICNFGISKENKLHYLLDYDLFNMSEQQLIELICDNVLPKEFKRLAYSEGGSEKRKDTIKELIKMYEDENKTEEEIETIISNELKEDEKEFENEHSSGYDNAATTKKVSKPTIDTPPSDEDILPKTSENLIRELSKYDMFSRQLVSYGDKTKFLAEVEIQKIWNQVLAENDTKSTKLIEMLKEKRNSSQEWLSYVIDEFFKEYDRTISITVDKEYSFNKPPKLMQKLMVYKVLENDSYLNLCGTGAGKTNALLMASRALSVKNTVIICPNGVVSTWKKAIYAIYPTSTVLPYTHYSELKSIESSNMNYIIINYDKFSNGGLSTKEKMDKFIETVKPQMLCFDELHNAKTRSIEDASIRNVNLVYFRQHAKEVYGDNFKVLGMTATPLINNLNEVRSLLELTTGKEYKEIKNRNTIENIHLAYKNLLLNGFRYVPDYGINMIETEVKIDGKHLKDSLICLKNSDINIIEGIFVEDKMNSVRKDLTSGTILYTTFIDKIIPKIEKKLKEFGMSYQRYTGQETSKERENILEGFRNKEFDILLASSPITTGVDGLQEFCNKIIFISLPWTNAEYTQLIGRINRQGSVFTEVNIIFPHIDIELDNGKIWSWDMGRKNIIVKKKTLSDAVVDGEFKFSANIDKSKLVKCAMEALRSGEALKDFEINREDVEAEPNENESSRDYAESVVNEIHRKANTSKSSTTHKFFTENEREWYKYHEAREKRILEWSEDPKDIIAKRINESGCCGIIADLGCGTNKLKDKVNVHYNKWLSFDHIALDGTVIKADITNLSQYIKDESVDIAVYCESLWGTNTSDYFKEAYRILKKGGLMLVAEPTNKFSGGQLCGMASDFGLETIFGKCTERYGINYLEFKKK